MTSTPLRMHIGRSVQPRDRARRGLVSDGWEDGARLLPRPRTARWRPRTVVESSDGPLGFATDDRGDFWIKEEGTAAGRVHVAFAAPNRGTVDAFQRRSRRGGWGRQRRAWSAASLSL